MVKKTLLFIVITVTLLIGFTACDMNTSLSDFINDPARTPPGWVSGISNFVLNEGAASSELEYSFSATNPAAAYTMYIAEGRIGRADEIIAGNVTRPVTPPSSGYYKITGLKSNTLYSAVIVAKSGTLQDAWSAVKQARTIPTPQNVMTITGYSPPLTGVTISAARVVDDQGARIAVANSSDGQVFNFYEPSGIADLINPLKPWNGTGSYGIVLVLSLSSIPVAEYKYTPAGGKYPFTGGSFSLAWSQFQQVQ